MAKPTLRVGVGRPTPSARSIAKRTNPVPAGRPVSNIGAYLFKPTDTTESGGEFVNTTPPSIQKVEQDYLKKGQLPPALQPKYLRKPEVMDTQRRKAISKGFGAQRSRI